MWPGRSAPLIVSDSAYPGEVRYLQRGAGTAFVLTAAALVVFWTVKGTRPSGHVVLPVLYTALGVSALMWVVAEALRMRRERSSRRTGNEQMNHLLRREFRKLKPKRRLRRSASVEQSIPYPVTPPSVDPASPQPADGREPPHLVVQHEPIRWDQINDRPTAGEEPIPLEPWLEDRIAAHAALVLQRPVRGDRWFFAALGEWDVRNTHELLTKVAPDLVDGYYRSDGIPGYRPGHEEEYYARQLKWLEDTLCALRASGAAVTESAS
jgi:hypothetical protein